MEKQTRKVQTVSLKTKIWGGGRVTVMVMNLAVALNMNGEDILKVHDISATVLGS